MTYNAFGQTLTIDGPRTETADVTTYAYYDLTDPCVSCRGNVKTTTNAAGHVTTFDSYDVDGQPTRVTDPNGVSTALSYDLRGRLRTRTVNAGSPLAETTGFDYDNVGQLVMTTMPDGSVLRYQYDAAHRLTEIVDGLGNVIQYTLDAMGNRIKEDVFDPADRLQRTHQRVYDVLNRLYNDIDAANQKSVLSYDANGNLKTSTDPLNRNTSLNYDALNRLLNSTDAAGGVTRYGYDAKDRLVSVRDPINLTTTYTYDGLGNLVRLASPDTGIANYVPDAAGNVVGSTDARGLATTYDHDALNRQTLATFPGGSVVLEYDNTATGGVHARGRLTKVTDPSGVTSYVYDAFGRVVRKTQTVGSDATARSFTNSYQYMAGRLTGIVLPSGRDMGYAFDAQGRVTGITVAGQPVLSDATYFPFGPVQGWTWANGQAYRRTFDADGRVATVTTGPDTAAFGGGSWQFGYDSLNRLMNATLPPGDAFAYTYDANGNRKQETRAGAVTNYGYFGASNRLQGLTGAAAKSFVYDAAGNLTSNGSVTFTYDGRGRLTQVSNGYRYAINGLGQRVSKSGPGGTTYFVYDEQGRLVGEYDGTGAVRQELAYLGDTPVASLRPAAEGSVDIFPIYSDHLNTPRFITDAENRTVWEWPLDTFGAGAANENPSGLGVFSFNLRFPGQYFDPETGLHYNYFRDYDPSVGRYVESDPIGLLGGLNGYRYSKDSPVVVIDRLGLMGSRGNLHAFDGCGPNGQILEWLIPDSPLGFEFRGCCDDHDDCYANCEGPPRETCDSDFCGCLMVPCKRYARGQRIDCEWLAGIYCDKAKKYGDKQFNASRIKCRRGCK
jgi:RHS repeat-associated protein